MHRRDDADSNRMRIIVTRNSRIFAIPFVLTALAMGGATGTAEASPPSAALSGCAGCASLAAPQAVRAETQIRISTSATAVVSRQPFTITARITSVDRSVVPAGSVVFFVNGRPQGDTLTAQRVSP